MSTAPQLGPSAAQIELMGHNIDMIIRTATTRRRRRTRLGLGIASVAVAASVTAGGVIVIATPEAQLTYYDCHTTIALDETLGGVVYDTQGTGTLPTSRAEFAVENCLLVYAAKDVIVPNPTPCLLPDLRVGVFPNENAEEQTAFCASLGLTPVPD